MSDRSDQFKVLLPYTMIREGSSFCQLYANNDLPMPVERVTVDYVKYVSETHKIFNLSETTWDIPSGSTAIIFDQKINGCTLSVINIAVLAEDGSRFIVRPPRDNSKIIYCNIPRSLFRRISALVTLPFRQAFLARRCDPTSIARKTAPKKDFNLH